MVITFIFAIVGCIIANAFMSQQSMRAAACLGTFLMIPCYIYFYWLYSQKHPDNRSLKTKELIYGILAFAVSNIGKGMCLTALTTYLSIMCRALTSGRLFGLFFTYISIFLFVHMILTWAFDFKHKYFMIFAIVLSVVCAALYLALPKEVTHIEDTPWHKESIKWSAVLKNCIWSIPFMATALGFFWAIEFLHEDFITHNSVNQIAAIASIAGALGASIFFGWGYDVQPYKMLLINVFVSLVAFILYVVTVFKIAPRTAIWACGFMAAASVGWIVLTFAYFRDYNR